MTAFYPLSPKEELSSLYVGKSIRDVPTPAAILDVAAARRNCEKMLAACDALNLGWRAHVKTHKTVELTRLQVGDAPRPVRIIVSTLAEADLLIPLLLEYKAAGSPINLLYGLPLGPSQVPRLAAIAKTLGQSSISILLDHPSQLEAISSFVALSGGVIPQVHVKIDMGGRRAGVILESTGFTNVVNAALDYHQRGLIALSGLYSHAGHSYAGDSQVAAMLMLKDELEALTAGAEAIHATSTRTSSTGKSAIGALTLSVGASPTALSIQNLLSENSADASISAATRATATSLSTLLTSIATAGHLIEIHAGVYPTLDLQQLAAHSVSKATMSWSDIAFTVLAEVYSVYPERGASGGSEALIGAGGLALGREFCKAYEGMAILTPWNREGVAIPTADVENHEGWMVGRFSQEHGICTWMGKGAEAERDELVVGQKVRLWPNHACITGSHFGWYFVVDSEKVGSEDEIVDIWVKGRGW